MDWRSAAHLLVTDPREFAQRLPTGARLALAQSLGPDRAFRCASHGGWSRRLGCAVASPAARAARAPFRERTRVAVARAHVVRRGTRPGFSGHASSQLRRLVDDCRQRTGGNSDGRGRRAQPRRSRLGRHPRLRLPRCAEPRPPADAVPPGGLQRARCRLPRRRDGRDARAANTPRARRPCRASRRTAEAVCLLQAFARPAPLRGDEAADPRVARRRDDLPCARRRGGHALRAADGVLSPTR